MQVTDDELRRLYQARTTKDDRSGCPGAAELAALASAELGSTERLRLLEHVAECASCALELKVAGEAAPWSAELSREIAGGSRPAPALPASRFASRAPERRYSRRLLPSVAAAAVTVLAIGAGVWLFMSPAAPPGDVMRGDSDLVAPAPGSELDQAPARLAWPPQAGAAGYRAVLFDASAERLWESPPLSGTELELPPEARALLRPDATYLWLVEVEGPATRRELGPYRFAVAP
jgi:hypothetical protein